MAQFAHSSEKFGQINLDTILGVQKALNALGYEAGKEDGIDGPTTQSGVKEFQGEHGLGVDGKAGPQTKAAIIHVLDTVVAEDAEE
ncbi:MAG TPA: peptidoglycan-binding domain-containing protein [Polyangiaceae bacterium]|nr:peptidoglycan-binding domain-containing protein [Polyangiaceae bacterium]HMR76706.1 peptidoglycan-binding domain-containing protein [Polyangiaceae bacterium]